MRPLERRCSAGALVVLAGLASIALFLSGTAAPMPEAAAEVAARAAAARTHTGPGRRLNANSGCLLGCSAGIFLAKYLSTDPPPQPSQQIHRKPLPMHATPAEREAMNSRIVQRAVTNSRLAEARAQIAASARPASSAGIRQRIATAAEYRHPHHNRTASPGSVGTLVHLPAAPTGPRGRYDRPAAASAWVSSDPARSKEIRLPRTTNGTSALRHESSEEGHAA